MGPVQQGITSIIRQRGPCWILMRRRGMQETEIAFWNTSGVNAVFVDRKKTYFCAECLEKIIGSAMARTLH